MKFQMWICVLMVKLLKNAKSPQIFKHSGAKLH